VSLSEVGKRYLGVTVAYFCWAILIATSTLTLKQHYLFDVVSGVGLASIIFYISRRVYLFRSISELVTKDVEFIPSRTSTAEVPVDC